MIGNTYVPSTEDDRSELEKQICDVQSTTNDLIEDSIQYYVGLVKQVYDFLFK
ncbi:MAG: hypothetical protein ABIF40_02150 [archaeon]